MNAPDAPAVAALHAALRELSQVLDRLDGARSNLVPAAATFWGGEARVVYDRALLDLGSSLDRAADLVLLARRSTQLALASESSRG